MLLPVAVPGQRGQLILATRLLKPRGKLSHVRFELQSQMLTYLSLHYQKSLISDLYTNYNK